MTSLKTSIKTITYLSDIGCLEIQGASLTTLIALCLPVSVFATTLRLSTDVDLLVLDGKKVSSSLLRGAD
ncbi:hypothetical protein GP954_36200, partial [Escherichia coli]|nr:hypothetical protein [Escherichia coli]